MPEVNNDERYMRLALALARKAEAAGEVPVGAVVVLNDAVEHIKNGVENGVQYGRVIGTGRNAPVALHDPTAHAEITALRAAALAIANYRLENTTLYVTVEPCAMCAGALVNARVARLVFGARDLRFGAVRSKFQLADADILNHRLLIEEGVLGAECAELMQRFFAARRDK